jgi:hypothetical protein
MLDYVFPYSYIAVCLGVCIGIGITATCIGLLSTFFIILCFSIGMIRITPLFSLLEKTFRAFFPETLSRIEKNIRESFKVSSTNLPEDRYIFMCHPHGVFASSLYFHTMPSLTNWPSHLKSKAVVFSNLRWLPFLNELFDIFNAIPSDYHSMKKELQEGSISLFPGGMREMLYEDTTILRKRRGIFKLALETGTPLVPVLSKGEAELCKILKIDERIQDWFKPFDACLPIPTWKSFTRILGICQYPLKDPVYTIIGDPIPVEKVEEPNEQQIADLKQKYIEVLSKMYKKEIGRDLKII